VVVSDLPWARERLRHGENAVFVRTDPDSVANGILRLLTDAAAARTVANEGLELVSTELNRSDQIRRLGELYDSIT
jgi:glycosyltransferase involved in cell wall biosynthesis